MEVQGGNPQKKKKKKQNRKGGKSAKKRGTGFEGKFGLLVVVGYV